MKQTELEHLHDKRSLPVYCQSSKMLTTQEILNILLDSDLESDSVCTEVPFGVNVNAAFTVDLSKLKSSRDVYVMTWALGAGVAVLGGAQYPVMEQPRFWEGAYLLLIYLMECGSVITTKPGCEEDGCLSPW